MKNTTVLISGAGVAGAALAYWLRRHGFTPTVVERAHGIRDGGYKIDIRGAALDVVRRMSLLDEIRARVTDVRAGSVVNGAGRRVASMDGDTFGGREHGDHTVGFAAYETALREFVARNQELGPANIKRMVLASKAQVRMSMAFLNLLSKVPGKDKLMAKAVAPIHRAANAVELADY